MAFAINEFEQTYRRCFAQAMGLAVTLLHDEEDARDIVQEVFTRLWETKVTIGNPDAFIFRSVRNACLNRFSMMTTRERIRRLLPLDTEAFEESTEQQMAAVRKATEVLLSERENEVVKEVFTHGYSYKEAAMHLGISTSAINKHVVNALRKLRKHFNTRKS